ncbi:MAG: serine hydrolase [Bacteroidetes bacterium]|nr:serine hydrolase [Bacteroidota bacterium]
MAPEQIEELNHCTSTYRRPTIIAYLLFLSTMNSAVLTAQPVIEAVARLHAQVAAEPSRWIEGFHSIISGSHSPYESHRSGAKRDPAYVARTAGGEEEFVWKTAAVPQKWNGDSLHVIWTCGFGNNLGKEWFELTVNDSIIIPFSTVNDGYWSIGTAGGMRLSFTAVGTHHYGANLGYMVLTVPRPLLKHGSPLTLRIRGRQVKDEIWYRLYAYTDVISQITTKERKQFYTSVDFIHMGDARISIIAGTKQHGTVVRVMNGGSSIAQSVLNSDGAVSRTVLALARSEQPSGAAFSIVIAGKIVIDTIDWSEINGRRIRAFMEEELTCNAYVFPPGVFPEFRWKNALLVENLIGYVPLRVRFLNAQFQEVQSAVTPGRYGAVIEGTTTDGFRIRRFVTLYCAPAEFDDYSKDVPVSMEMLQQYGISKDRWFLYTAQKERFSFGSLKLFPAQDPDAAVFLAGLAEVDLEQYSFDTPRIRDRQWWITAKRTLDGDAEPLKQLPPIAVSRSSTGIASSSQEVIRPRYDSASLQRLRSISREWADKSGVPHVVVIWHKGNIIEYRAFGSNGSGTPITIRSVQWMASITKLLTGVLMMQFVDQGIVALDSPVSAYLPELKQHDRKEMTIRNLFDHTTGLQFAKDWASDWNNALENQIAQVLPYSRVESAFSYNRVGYAIAGKVIERLTGKPVPYLFQERIFGPLGMKSAYADNTYGGLYCEAIHLAALGHMLLYGGEYDGVRILSSEAVAAMQPQRLPVGDRQWGIGTSSYNEYGLSPSAYGHGAASGTVFRIDPANELIIISARSRTGAQHHEYEKAFIQQCMALINRK